MEIITGLEKLGVKEKSLGWTIQPRYRSSVLVLETWKAYMSLI